MAAGSASRGKSSGNGAGRVEDRPAQIVDIASRLFARHGYDGTSLRDIAQEAQISKAALYYHFPNKEALYQQLVVGNMEALIDRVCGAVKQAGSATGKVRAFMLTSADIYGESPHIWMAGSSTFWTGISAETRAAAVSRRDRFEHLLRAAIAEGVASGEFRAVDPAIAGTLLLSTLNQLNRWLSSSGRLTPRQVIEDYLEILLPGLSATAPPAR